MTQEEILEIDGSFGEGGGSILRIGAAFSILYQKPIRIKNIRANRSKPGLRIQHLKGLKALAILTNSSLSECKVGTKEITLIPRQSIISNLEINIETAGNIGLLLQPLQIACLGFSEPERIEIMISGGGTFGAWAPSLSYLNQVTYQLFRDHNYEINIDIIKHGFYPKGGASVKCSIFPPKHQIKPIILTKLGNIDLIQGEIIIANQLKNANIGERVRKSAEYHIKKELKVEVKIKHNYVNSLSPGVGLSLWACSDSGAIISSGTVLGERKISSEQLGKKAAYSILTYIQKEIPVDNYLSDQLIPFMGICQKASRIKVLDITSHTKTNLELIKLFSNRNYNISKENHSYIIEIQ
jgi:RNA 3'-terminal phosphate cyclase (ATP)/RNA 3'-terminal phosphate cyclase (GTP)